jgi:hypothetical protein
MSLIEDNHNACGGRLLMSKVCICSQSAEGQLEYGKREIVFGGKCQEIGQEGKIPTARIKSTLLNPKNIFPSV